MTNDSEKQPAAENDGAPEERPARHGKPASAQGRHAQGRQAARPTFRNPLAELLHRRKSTVTIGDVRYFDGAELSRPLEMPLIARRVTLGAMIAAALIGIVFLVNYFDFITNEPLRQQEALQENLTREVSYDLPSLAALMPLDDEAMMASLTETGATFLERVPVGTNPDGGFEVIKLPPDMTVDEAGALYLKGIDKLSAADAVRLLRGAWTLDVSRKAGESLRLRYADFESGTIEKAVQNAMKTEGLEAAEVTDNGVDDSGNTFQAGTVSTENGTYSWRVSVIELSEMYDVSGLPNTAYFVGIRFSA